MDLQITDKVIIVYLEATCWEDDSVYQKKHSEIIEIGVCYLNVNTGVIESNQGLLVKPVNLEISDFCTKLTSITPTILEKEGFPLRQAVFILNEQYEPKKFTWGSYGGL